MAVLHSCSQKELRSLFTLKTHCLPFDNKWSNCRWHGNTQVTHNNSRVISFYFILILILLWSLIMGEQNRIYSWNCNSHFFCLLGRTGFGKFSSFKVDRDKRSNDTNNNNNKQINNPTPPPKNKTTTKHTNKRTTTKNKQTKNLSSVLHFARTLFADDCHIFLLMLLASILPHSQSGWLPPYLLSVFAKSLISS